MTWIVLYEVPAGRTARFSLVTVEHFGGAANLVSVGIRLGATDTVAWEETLGTRQSREVLRGLVLNPGDKLTVNTNVANVVFVAGFGSLLLGEPG